MTLTDVVMLAGIIAAFMLFAVVLAWGEYQTRGLKQTLEEEPQRRSEPDKPIEAHGAPSAQAADRKARGRNTIERETVRT